MDEPVAQDLPNELLAAIVELAAAASVNNCYNLSLVSHAFNIWTKPLLYNRLDYQSIRAAQAFLGQLLHKHTNFFAQKTHIESISFAQTTPNTVTNTILAHCSHRLLNFSIRSTETNTHPCKSLAFIKSPSLRRLSFVWVPEGALILDPFATLRGAGYAHLRGPTSPYNHITVELMSSVTHFISYTPTVWWNDRWYRTWSYLVEAGYASNPLNTERIAYWDAFQRLTHLMMATQNYQFVIALQHIAQNIRYLAFLHNGPVESELVHKLAEKIEERFSEEVTLVTVRKPWWRRFVVLDLTDMDELHLVNSTEQEFLWEKVQRLIEGGLYSATGGLWKDMATM